jgi:hypothetical protein
MLGLEHSKVCTLCYFEHLGFYVSGSWSNGITDHSISDYDEHVLSRSESQP